MTEIKEKIEEVFFNSLNETCQYLKSNEQIAFLEDRFTGITRTRTTAELCSAMIKIHKLNVKNYKETIKKITNWLITKQNKDGSWNETHTNYDNPSSVFTAICGLTLLEVSEEFADIKIPREVLDSAASFLLKQEIKNGHFRKSEHYHADVFNADAMVSAFLIKYGVKWNIQQYVEAAKRGIKNIILQQKKNGEFPYGSKTVQYPYKYHLDVPCIHYQAVILYYLEKCREFYKDNEVENSIRNGIKWLQNNQKTSGEFDWKNSGLNFALYLTATYAFAVFLYSRYDPIEERSRILNTIRILNQQYKKGILLRWEKSSVLKMIYGILFSLKGGTIGNYPINFKILRTLHRIHREISRLRVSSKMTPSKITRVKTGYSAILSTVESSTNYPDLYMTTQALDTLAAILEKGKTL